MFPPTLTRRQALALAGASLVPLPGLRRQDPNDRDTHDPLTWGVEGQGWSDTARPYDRLPARAEGVVRDAVWRLSRHSAGMLAGFETDATSFDVQVSLLSGDLAMPHMPATGVSGLDLYGRTDAGTWRWIQCAQPRAQRYTLSVKGLLAGRRAYRLYLPLYNGVEALAIEVPKGAAFTPVAPRRARPIVYYGTSIAHGACASRPGMAFPSILGRRLDRPVINLGFSGNGKMEPEVAALLAELDPAVYVIDCLPNMNAALVTERAAPLVRVLRAARPTTPIVLVEDRRFSNSPWFPARQEHHDQNHAALRAAYQGLVADGVEGLQHVADAPFLGEDGEASVDGSHPTDLGMARYAHALEPVLRPLLGE